ncbi:MAG: hypothetical protein HRU48_04665 [Vibrio sp.]|uniref:hypothetical protein n=1 Tax=Vibrio TaxID=662 RepID=UPI001EC76D2A|nr:hypothetical protein [Vibrio sp.]NRB66654.1 hypothetical protein [Vibrio sp.]
MSNRIAQIERPRWRVESVAGRHEADPELKQRFMTLFHKRQNVDLPTDKPQVCGRIPSSILNELSSVNHVATWGNAEIYRGQNSLTFKLLNGPMSGLVITAQWMAQDVLINLKPKNQKQRDALTRIMPKITHRLSESTLQMTIEVNRYD